LKYLILVVFTLIILVGNAYQGYGQTTDSWYYFTSIAFSPDGKQLAAGTLVGIVKIWDTDSWQDVKTLPKISKEIHDISLLNYSPDGKFLIASANETHIIVWDTKLWKKQLYFRAHKKISLINVSPDSRYIITADREEEHVLKAWDLITGKELWKIDELYVKSMSISSDGTYLAVLGWGHSFIDLYDMKSLQKIKNTSEMTNTIKPQYGTYLGDFYYVVFIPNSHTLLIAYTDGIMVVNLDEGMSKILAYYNYYDGRTGGTDYLIASPDGKFCAFGLGWNGKENISVAVYNNMDQKMELGLAGDSIITSAAFSPDSKFVAAAGHNTCQIQLWDMATGKLIITLGKLCKRTGK
jgi:WD40 repeat protein